MATNMTSLREERTISEVQRLSQAGLEAPELLRRVACALHRIVPFEMYAAATIDPASNLIVSGFGERMDGDEGLRPINPRWFEHYYFEEAFDQTVDLARSGKWATTLEAETGGQLERSLCYRETMRPAGIEHKAQAVFVDRNLWGDMDFYRGRGSAAFSSREIEIIRRLAPSVGAGLKIAALRARGLADEPIDDMTPGVLVIDQQGHVTGTRAAEMLLAELDELHPRWRDGNHLPVAVQVVLNALRWSLDAGPEHSQDVTPRLRVRGRSGRWLALHAACSEATETCPAQRLVVIAPAAPQELVWLGMTAFGLSAREEDVVKLVVGGLSTRQISDRLYIAEHTVQRHLSNIFEKVGVRSRRDLVKQLFFEQVLPGASVA
jgi:DNA-binding CsgD family transcriptional regulator